MDQLPIKQQNKKPKKIKKKEKIVDYNSNLKFIDLCCGIGGFHYALKNMDFECVMACDIDKECRINYELNHKIKPLGDLTNIKINTIPSFDILCAGFPCQPFSKAGSQEGFNDKKGRGNIFFDICKIIEYHKPKYLILENVRNLASHDEGNTWKVIKEKINELNYYTYDETVILNTRYFGVPQSRERVIIICKRKDLGELPVLPSINKENLKNTSLTDIIEEGEFEKYKISDKLKETEEVWNNFLNICIQKEIPIPKFPIWTDWWDSDGDNTKVTKYDHKISEEDNKIKIKKEQEKFYKKYKNWIDKNRDFYNTNLDILQPWIEESRKKKLWLGAVRKMEWQTDSNNLNIKQTLWSPRGSGVRIKRLDYSPTLVAMASMIPIYGPKSRQLTPRECARLQSFPEDYIIHNDDKVSYSQFGNAVNVKMIERCARFLIKGEPLFI